MVVGWIAGRIPGDWGIVVVACYTIVGIRIALGRVPWLRKVDCGLRVPWRRGNAKLNEMLARMYQKIDMPDTDMLRLTLFAPDTRRKALVQLARYAWNTDTAVSPTEIRMGTCAVGHAYNRDDVWYVEDVDGHGGFDESLRLCGLTPDEVEVQTRHDRRAFVAIPIHATNSKGKRAVLAVLAADTKTAKRFHTQAFPSAVLRFAPEIRLLLGASTEAADGLDVATPLPGSFPALLTTNSSASGMGEVDDCAPTEK